MELDNEFFMKLAINLAWEAQCLALPNPAVGALVQDSSGAILALESHTEFGAPHAEILALKSAYFKLTGDSRINELRESSAIHAFLRANHNGIFHATRIFSTLEPCMHFGKTPPCAELLAEIRPQFVGISALDSSQNGGGAAFLRARGIDVRSGIAREEGQDLLLPFSCLQKNNAFRLFKIAQRLNGSFKNGLISCQDSQIFSHKMRARAERIIISTKTVLSDNPHLDTRFVPSLRVNPNVCILGSKENLKKCADKSLKIYRAKNREVALFSDLRAMPKSGFSIIEGGDKMFKSFKNEIDCMLIVFNAKMARGASLSSNFRGKIMHARHFGEDVMLWIRPR